MLFTVPDAIAGVLLGLVGISFVIALVAILIALVAIVLAAAIALTPLALIVGLIQEMVSPDFRKYTFDNKVRESYKAALSPFIILIIIALVAIALAALIAIIPLLILAALITWIKHQFNPDPISQSYLNLMKKSYPQITPFDSDLALIFSTLIILPMIGLSVGLPLFFIGSLAVSAGIPSAIAISLCVAWVAVFIINADRQKSPDLVAQYLEKIQEPGNGYLSYTLLCLGFFGFGIYLSVLLYPLILSSLLAMGIPAGLATFFALTTCSIVIALGIYVWGSLANTMEEIWDFFQKSDISQGPDAGFLFTTLKLAALGGGVYSATIAFPILLPALTSLGLPYAAMVILAVFLAAIPIVAIKAIFDVVLIVDEDLGKSLDACLALEKYTPQPFQGLEISAAQHGRQRVASTPDATNQEDLQTPLVID